MPDFRPALLGAAATAALFAAAPAAGVTFNVTNLVSNGAVPAVTIDPNLVNPWGLARSATGPFWVNDADRGLSTLYNGAGAKIPLEVTVPPPPGSPPPGAPTGIVFNNTANGFQVNGSKATFIFDTEGGTIDAWNGSLGTTAATMVDNSPSEASYKGLALGGNELFAANFHAGTIDVFDDTFTQQAASFTDPTLASGYAPFNVQLLGGELYVAYAKQDAAAEDEIPGAGLGYVDVYDLNGNLLRRIASQGDPVNAPWGLAIAPSTFRQFAGALLVGNFGDGTISAFDRTTGTFLGRLRGHNGDPLSIDGLWALVPGNGGLGGDPGRIYFTAGLNDERDGLFGSLSATPEPGAWTLMILGLGLAGAAMRVRRRAALG